jgi:hypothetical protein
MRQFFTLGFWLSLLALAGLTAGLLALTRDDGEVDELLPDIGIPALPEEREIDLIGMVFLAQADSGFAIVDGRTTGDLQIRIDGFRYMNVMAGTPGENRCAALSELAQCAIAADLLGEAVLWFSIVPLSPRNLVELPGPSGLREGNRLQLTNGWIVDRAEIVERDCEEDTSGLTDLIDRFGADATTVYSLDEQQVVRVTCAAAGAGDGTVPTEQTVVVPVVPAPTVAPEPTLVATSVAP